MLKVMIVDDEPSTREGLEMFIPWEDLGFEIVGTAEDGFDAIEKYKELKPNLMMVDMKMPEMSGIELIQKIREVDSSIQFIVLSGFAEFEYARNAMKYNVKDYLVKPVDEDELIPILTELAQGFIKEEEFSRVKKKMDEENKERVIQAAVTGECMEELKELCDHLKWNRFRILLIEVKKNEYALGDIKKQLKQVYELDKKGLIFTTGSYIGILLNADQEVNNNIAHIYKAIHQNIQTKFVASISQTFKEIEDLSTQFNIASDLIKDQFFYDEGIILHSDSKPVITVEEGVSKDKISSLQLSEVVEQLVFALEIGDKKVIERICMNAGKYMIFNELSEQTIKEKYIEIVTSLLKKLMYENKNIHEKVSNILSRVYEIETQSKLTELLTYVTNLLEEMLDSIDSSDSDILVKKMIKLIEQNYYKNIKLETLAKVLNYNRFYLGKLFRDYTGEYFNTYLDKIRIENGKKLLLQGLKVYEVAEQVGFSNVDYFHSKFKKYVGESPSSYKKNHGLS
ncbi:response regulator transcription factor [Metabacillus halosaccharovorans]|uniref:response regulator transcription factor n=1 Tax=Metabacillus halosaccharovorans TaxID=930124 RepID=UPI0020411D58|nr:response regulator transcription factor [Metabacillus halosaccharovorans]MCM3440219.1 response regulator transcription factor [Metabacillus halosaccharovorans]